MPLPLVSWPRRRRSGEESRQIDLLDEALNDPLRLIPPEDLEIRVTRVRLVIGRWWLGANIRWRGAAQEDTSSVSLEIEVALRIAAVGRPS